MTYSRQIPVSAGGYLTPRLRSCNFPSLDTGTMSFNKRRIKRAKRRHDLRIPPLSGDIAIAAHKEVLMLKLATAGEHETLGREYFIQMDSLP